MDPGRLMVDEYTRMALVYEERVVPRFEVVARRVAADAALQPGERVLDVACGTGLATLLAAEAVGPSGSVVGVDLAEGQLGVAAGKAALRGLAHVAFERADARGLGAGSPGAGSFDAALCCFGLPAEAGAVLAGMRAALRPGGRASVATWPARPVPFFDAFQQALAARKVPDPDPELAALRAAVEARRAARSGTGTAEDLAGAMREAGFRDVAAAEVEHAVAFPSWREAYQFHLAWGWTEREVRALPAPGREALQREAAALYGPGPVRPRWPVLHATGRAP